VQPVTTSVDADPEGHVATRIDARLFVAVGLIRSACSEHAATWPEDQVAQARLEQLADELDELRGQIIEEATPAG
jgi:hypothetical protein